MKTSTSLASSALILAGAMTAAVPLGGGPPEPAGLRPTAALVVDIRAKIYLDDLMDSAAARQTLQDSLIAVLAEEFAYVDWTSDTTAPYRVTVSVIQNDSTSNPSFLEVGLSSWPGDSLVKYEFEDWFDIFQRTDWSPQKVAEVWGARLHAIARDKGLAIQQELMAELPLLAQPEIIQLEAVIPVPEDSLRAAHDPLPEFMLKVVVVDSQPIVTEQTATFYLRPCRANAREYACEINRANYLNRAIDSTRIAAEFDKPDIKVLPQSAHLWIYYPNRDPR